MRCLMLLSTRRNQVSDIFWRSKVKETRAIPDPSIFPEKTHWWLGRFIVLFSIVVVFLRITELQLPYWVYGVFAARYGLVFVAVIVLFIINYRHMLKVYKLEKKQAEERERDFY